MPESVIAPAPVAPADTIHKIVVHPMREITHDALLTRGVLNDILLESWVFPAGNRKVEARIHASDRPCQAHVGLYDSEGRDVEPFVAVEIVVGERSDTSTVAAYLNVAQARDLLAALTEALSDDILDDPTDPNTR